MKDTVQSPKWGPRRALLYAENLNCCGLWRILNLRRISALTICGVSRRYAVIKGKQAKDGTRKPYTPPF